MPPSPTAARPRVALIGVSGYARIHLEFLEELRAARVIELTAATVVNPTEEPEAIARLQAEGCRVYGDFREMLERHRGALDLCCIPTGIPLHETMAIAALEAGANVLVEKPLAPTTAAVAAIAAAERATGRWVAVGFQDLYLPETRAWKQRLAGGEIGPLRRVCLRGLWPRDSSYYGRNDWAGRVRRQGQPVFDSPLSNAFSHFLNLALFVAGDSPGTSARPVEAQGRLLRAQPIENFDTAVVRWRTKPGVEILAYVSHSCASVIEPEVAVEGADGRALWQLGREIRTERRGERPSAVPLSDPHAARRAMFRQAVAHLTDPAAFVCSTAVAAEHTRAFEMAQELPVQAIAPEFLVRSRTPDGYEATRILGLEETFARAWNASCLLDALPPTHAQSFYHVRPPRPDRRVSSPA